MGIVKMCESGVRSSRRKTFLFIVILLLGMTVQAAWDTPAAEQVHTIYWKASLRRSVKVNKLTLKKGTPVVVINRSYHSGTRSKVRYRDLVFSISNSALSYKGDLTTISKGDYSTQVKEAFINGRKKAASKTSWLIWVSLDKQRVNVFRGQQGAWDLVKVFKCSTGKAHTPTVAGWNTIDVKRKYVSGCKYYTEVNGSGIHKWPGTVNKKVLGYHTASHSCIRLYENSAKWIYDHVPRKTKVLVY